MTDVNRAAWRKSSYSGQEGGTCVELANLDASVGIRDSQRPSLGHLNLAKNDLAALVVRIKAGQFDL